ncbi:hypothetical protein GW17_00036225 [Ensete ventricosum]|nr:hypothetical protein GW17_00036225 [Ensete ventricosum]
MSMELLINSVLVVLDIMDLTPILAVEWPPITYYVSFWRSCLTGWGRRSRKITWEAVALSSRRPPLRRIPCYPAFSSSSSSSSSSQAPYLQPYPPQSRLRHPHDRARSSSFSPACPSLLPGIFRRPSILLYLEHDLGVDSSALNPSLRSAPLPALRASADSLLSFGLGAPTMLASSPCTPPCSLAVGRCPRLLVSSVSDQLCAAPHFLRRRTTLLLVSSVEDALLPNLGYLRRLGFSHEETRSMVLRSPGLLTFSIKNYFRPKVEFLIHNMGRDFAELKDFPP